jgi:malate synthase
VTVELFEQLLAEELGKVKEIVGEDNFASGTYEKAAELFAKLTISDEFVEFLTLPAYELI